jgi:hypothetical protein
LVQLFGLCLQGIGGRHCSRRLAGTAGE